MKRAVRVIVFKDDNILVVRRNKFGTQYYTLLGGGVDINETLEMAARREMREEACMSLGVMRPVFIEQAEAPYGTQYVFLADYIGGEPVLDPKSDEAAITKMGQNMYQPMWLPISQLPDMPFRSERLKRAVLEGIKHGFSDQITEVV